MSPRSRFTRREDDRKNAQKTESGVEPTRDGCESWRPCPLACWRWPPPVSADEDLVSYLTKGKRKVAKKVRYQFVCSADCQVTVSSKIKLKGPDVPPLVDTAQFAAGVPIAHSLTLNKSLREAITDHIGASKLVSEVRATNTATGESDTDRRTFSFKKK